MKPEETESYLQLSKGKTTQANDLAQGHIWTVVGIFERSSEQCQETSIRVSGMNEGVLENTSCPESLAGGNALQRLITCQKTATFIEVVLLVNSGAKRLDFE